MTSWETCQIVNVTLREFQIRGFLFWDIHVPGVYRWEARVVRPSGLYLIHKSEEYKWGSSGHTQIYREEHARNAAYQKLIAVLSVKAGKPLQQTKMVLLLL